MGTLRMVQPDKPSRFGNFREMTTADWCGSLSVCPVPGTCLRQAGGQG